MNYVNNVILYLNTKHVYIYVSFYLKLFVNKKEKKNGLLVVKKLAAQC
jgi:hypothetical protein